MAYLWNKKHFFFKSKKKQVLEIKNMKSKIKVQSMYVAEI